MNEKEYFRGVSKILREAADLVDKMSETEDEEQQELLLARLAIKLQKIGALKR